MTHSTLVKSTRWMHLTTKEASFPVFSGHGIFYGSLLCLSGQITWDCGENLPTLKTTWQVWDHFNTPTHFLWYVWSWANWKLTPPQHTHSTHLYNVHTYDTITKQFECGIKLQKGKIVFVIITCVSNSLRSHTVFVYKLTYYWNTCHKRSV